MNKIFFIISPKRIHYLSVYLFFFIGFFLSGCFKDFKQDFLFTDFVVEFDDATWESPLPGKDYPLLGPYEKGSGVHTFKVNLVGAQSSKATSISYRIDTEETTAEEGKHFRLSDNGTFEIAANSNSGEVSIEILDFPPESGARTLVLELIDNQEVTVSRNYSRIGISISLTGPPSQIYPLHPQIGGDNMYNSIYFDMYSPALPGDVFNRIKQCAENLAEFADKTRRFQYLYLHFGEEDVVTVVALYYGGGGAALGNSAVASWSYKLNLNEEGIGRFEFTGANGNGNSQRSNFAPILSDYLEKYEFKVDWVSAGIASPPRNGVLLGGLFRTDNSSSYILGTLETLNSTGTIRPYPSSPAVHQIFDNGNGGYFSTIFIDPDVTGNSQAFVDRWAAGKAYIESLAGRRLHKLMLYYNPAYNFQDIRVVNFYYSSAGGKFIGQMRSTLHVDYDAIMQPLKIVYQDGNGGVTRAPEIVDNFLMKEEFKMERTGQIVRFTNINNPIEFFEGELGDLPLSTNQSWWP